MIVYNFCNFNQNTFTKFNDKNNEQKRRSGVTGTVVTQKNLRLGNTNNGKKALEKLVEIVRAHSKLETENALLELGAVRPGNCYSITTNSW